MALSGLYCADVPLSNYSLAHSVICICVLCYPRYSGICRVAPFNLADAVYVLSEFPNFYDAKFGFRNWQFKLQQQKYVQQ